MSKTSLGPFDEPLRILCVDGEVVVIGPAHMHGAFTTEAARLSAVLLAQVAREATPKAEGPDEAGDEAPPGSDGII